MKRYIYSAYRRDLPGPGDYDPPESPEPTELADAEEEFEVLVDADITVDSEGNWDYDDAEPEWAVNDQHPRGDFRGDEYNVFLADANDVAENSMDLLEGYIPQEAGRYHITCIINFVYDLTNINDYPEYYGKDEDDNLDVEHDIDIDSIDVSWNREKSSVSRFKFKKK